MSSNDIYFNIDMYMYVYICNTSDILVGNTHLRATIKIETTFSMTTLSLFFLYYF